MPLGAPSQPAASTPHASEPEPGPSGSTPPSVPVAGEATGSSPTADPAAPPEWADALGVIASARATARVRALGYDQGLATLAQGQAEVYAAGAENWPTFGEDLQAAGFAQGSARVGSGTSATEVVAQWLDSPEQSDALLDPQFGSVGVGSAPWEGQQVYVLIVAYRADDGSMPAGSDGAEEALVATNIQRARGGLLGLTINDRLNAAAQEQADHQAAILEMTHDGGGGLGERVLRAGYDARVAAENVAVGYPSVGEVMGGWIDSEGHYANIMNPDVTEMGFAVAFGSDGRAYFAQVFGAPL